MDRDSELLAHLLDERDPGVKRLIAMVIDAAHRKGRTVGICGQAPSDYPDFAEFLAGVGIDSMSLNPDSLPGVAERLARVVQPSNNSKEDIMSPQEQLGPFCQSCSMPLEKPEDFGTSASGQRVNDYCRYCYQHGAFTDSSITLDRMVDLCAGIMARRGVMPEGKARDLLAAVLPGMKRWRDTATQEACQCAGRRGLQAGDPEC